MNTFFMRSYGPWSSSAADKEEAERKAKEEADRRKRARAEQSARAMHERDRKNADHDRMLVSLEGLVPPQCCLLRALITSFKLSPR